MSLQRKTQKNRMQKCKTKKILNLVVSLIVCLSTVFSLCPIHAGAAEKKRTVRVGCSISTGYHQRGEDDKITGYGYAYEQILAQYANWDITYVEGSWSELQTMLKNGEIDTLGFLVETDERDDIYDFASTPSGTSLSCLVVAKDNAKYAYQDYEAFDGMTIACQSSNANLLNYLFYASEHDFHVKFQYCNTYQDVYDAIDTGTADAGLMTNFQNLSDYTVVDQLLSTNFYYAVQAGNTGLLNELNNAISDINSYYNDLPAYLYEQYYDVNNGKNTTFSQADLEYLATNPTVKVAMGGREKPFEYYDKESDSYQGIVPDVLQRITDITGITFEYIKTEERWAYDTMDVGNNVMTSISCDAGWAKERNLLMTQPFIEGSVSVVSKDPLKKAKKAALVENLYVNYLYLDRNPEVEPVYYSTKKECLNAVKNGECDCTVMNSYEADYFLAMGRYQTLNESTMQNVQQDICFGLKDTCDEELFDIISKALLMINTHEYEEIVRQNVNALSNQSVMDLVYTNPVQMISFTTLSAVLIALTIALAFYAVHIKRKNQEIVAANNAKTDFLSRMSHDIRTPMNTIVNLTKIVQDEINDTAAAMADLKKIETSNQFLLALVNDVLDMSKIEEKKIELHPERYSYSEFLAYLHSTFEPLAQEKNIELKIEKGDQDPDIIIDKVRFNQLCFNLIANAIKYTPAGGHVTFKMVHGIIEGGLLPCDIYVVDDGIGMSQEFQKKMFEPFSQEGRAYKTVEGTGLGLPIVKEIVELFHGKIDVQSAENKGTVFHIKFNMLIAKKKEKEEENQVVDIAILQGKEVLVAEDHPLNQQIAKRLLEKVGVITTLVDNGVQAVAEFNNHSDKYDAILMDIRMPEMNGIQATQEIRALNIPKAQSIPIIAMTANAYAEDTKECHAAGMNAHLAKPVNPEELYETLARYMRK